jgi:predicted membrane chloride channel (bestrophin family)
MFTRSLLRYLPYVVCAVLFLLELGLKKLVQSTSRYQKLIVWMSDYQKSYRQSTTISRAEVESPDIMDPKNELL